MSLSSRYHYFLYIFLLIQLINFLLIIKSYEPNTIFLKFIKKNLTTTTEKFIKLRTLGGFGFTLTRLVNSFYLIF
jgi:hypothetical protein